ncbi:hypothetical protein [Lyngbya sp. PCC 8106]|uniref:GspE/PulE/PilB domain-containing protein n=1 Tax=Lyngbya sp. (strain PCC 8106) TaxID=313612 RepID=UPI0000EACE6C|nr:hypothetical protein [Lyngbya sp. PCC 8106]EAW36056.1 hypothetical protein L8106_19386 [Lyngbya sp. PCC 8106]
MLRNPLLLFDQQMLAQTPTNEATSMDAEQIFPLIDSILPFEVCLHYQVLPLSLTDDCLHLGVVDPDDHSALDYVNKILAYRNCSIVTQKISFPDQEVILSAYLYRTQHPNSEVKTPKKHSENGVEVDHSYVLNRHKNPNKNPKICSCTESKSTQGKVNASLNSSTPVAQSTSETSEIDKSVDKNLLNLEIYTNHLNDPLEILATLTPDHLLHELLGRILAGGIGRLYFECQASTGRILWSQDGVLKSVLEDLEVNQFQGVINELKRLLELPLIPVDQPKQAEVERIYRGSHILLRLRVTPGEYGEEANLQVLRGAALKFHQQHKMTILSRDALRLAQQLEKKLAEIEERANSTALPSDNLPLLTQLLKTILHQVEELLHKNEL